MSKSKGYMVCVNVHADSECHECSNIAKCFEHNLAILRASTKVMGTVHGKEHHTFTTETVPMYTLRHDDGSICAFVIAIPYTLGPIPPDWPQQLTFTL